MEKFCFDYGLKSDESLEPINLSQIEKINNGLEKGLDVSIYAKHANPEFDLQQMKEIYLGSEQGLDIIRNVLTKDLKKSGIDNISYTDIKFKQDGIYFLDEKLTTMEDLLEIHPELQLGSQTQELEQDSTEDHDWEE